MTVPTGTKGERLMIGSNSIYATQALTLAIPLGVFVVVLLWGFFQRRETQ